MPIPGYISKKALAPGFKGGARLRPLLKKGYPFSPTIDSIVINNNGSWTVTLTNPSGTLTDNSIYVGATKVLDNGSAATTITVPYADVSSYYGTTVNVYATASNAQGEGPKSAAYSLSVFLPAPTTPTLVASFTTAGTFTINWNGSDPNLSSGYVNVYRSGILLSTITTTTATYTDTSAPGLPVYTICAATSGGTAVGSISAGVSWTPLLNPSGSLFWDAADGPCSDDAGATPATNGGYVNSWVDQISGIVASCGGVENQCIYANATGAPYVNFMGFPGQQMTATIPSVSQEFLVFSALQNTQDTSAKYLCNFGSSAATVRFTATSLQLDAGTTLSGTITLDLNPHYITADFKSTTSISRMDGVQLAEGNAGTNATGTSVVIGGLSTSNIPAYISAFMLVPVAGGNSASVLTGLNEAWMAVNTPGFL
jgi:hypothetical protein